MIRSFSICHFFLGFLCLFILSCEEQKKEQLATPVLETPEEKVSNPSSNFIVFTITTDDDNYELDYVNLLDYSNFFGSWPSELPTDVFRKAADSVQFLLKDLRQPQIMEILIFAETVNDTRFLVTPGDTVHLEIKNEELQFSGTNAAHYNFYGGLSNSEYAQNPYRGDLQQYKTETEKIYNRRKAYFEKYVEENPKVSEAFKEQVSAELKFEYLYNLVAPRSIEAESLKGIYVNNMDGISAFLNDTRAGKEQILNLETYFDGIVIEDLQRPELVNNDYFKRNLVDLIRHYFAQNEVPGYTEENLKRELEFINKHFEGELKKVAIGKLIWDYHRQGFGRGEEEKKFFQNVIANYKDQPLKSSYVEEISVIEDYLELMSSSIPETIMEDRLVNLQGDTLTVANVLKKSGGKIRYLDFWATWCPPCIADFRISKNFKERIASEENVDFIYISVDEDVENWREKSELLKDYLASEEQYVLLDVKSSKLLSFLKIRGADRRISVPKYTAIDEKGAIISGNAPRPSDSLAVEELLKEIK